MIHTSYIYYGWEIRDESESNCNRKQNIYIIAIAYEQVSLIDLYTNLYFRIHMNLNSLKTINITQFIKL